MHDSCGHCLFESKPQNSHLSKIKTTTNKNPVGEGNQNLPRKSSAISEYNPFVTEEQGDIKYLTYFWVP
jgi:hypothetical protein